MITELNFAKLTPASFALANANDVDAGVGRSMLLNNIRHGREVDHIMTGLDPEYLPDWAALKPQYEALEHGGVTSAVTPDSDSIPGQIQCNSWVNSFSENVFVTMNR